MLRITGIGAGAVDYLLRGCDGPEHAHERELERADAAELGADVYFAHAMERGEPAGVYFGQGWDALGLSEIVAGREAADDEVRAIFGQLRRPDSTERDPRYIGSRPHRFVSYDDRLDKLRAAEPDATPERLRAMEREARAGGTRNVAYYDFTFSPVKSVSVLYAAYLSAGDRDSAQAVRGAHDEAVQIALAYAESQVAFTRRGGAANRTYVQAEGLAAVLFAHHTSREGEPQLHTHAAVLNRAATLDGHIGALDGKGFRAFKEAIATAYERAVEQLVTEATGLRFETRPDGVAREVAGMDPALLAESSTRRGQVTARVRELVEQYRERHGREPSAAARKVMAQEATYSTRAAKTGLAGPKAVAAWVDRGHQRRDRLATALATVERVAGQATGQRGDVANGMAGPVATELASAERVEAALAAGLADVQAKYATWQLGNLVDAIDRHLGDAAALGVPAAERAAHLEALARRVLDPGEGFGVVQLTAHEAVPVPGGLCRSDGRPVWRPHEERRFATVAHLGTEAGVVDFASGGGARHIEVAEVETVLERAGLSADQDAAVRAILGSGRRGEVLIGPAGTGKSRTIGTLAQAWGQATGGTVYGVATAQIATSNLAGDGLTALNSTRFVDQVTPDPVTGHARRPLHAQDLVVLDEASMTSVGDIAAISTAAARAGAKVVYVGDPAQLSAVEAGGLFAHLTDTLPTGQVHELAQPHRFVEAWEAEASLWLRTGDQRAVDAYLDQGRLYAGTIEEMTAAARRGWLADRCAGLDAVLVVGSNQTAAEVSRELQAELQDLGRVRGAALGILGDENKAHLGDVVETRRNAWQLPVDPSPTGRADAVMNRGRYTVVGRGQDGTILGRDRHGAVAHLPVEYLAEHAALAYASTVFAAEGVSVDASHDVVDRDATREALYVGMSRGGRHNYAYLVTEREPDAHEPQRLDEVAAERFAAVLATPGAERSASAVLAADEGERTSAATLLARLEHVTRATVEPHLEVVRGRLDVELDPDDRSTGRLAAALQAVELAGHDPGEVLERAITARGFDDVDDVPAALAHRLRGQLLAADPDPAPEHTDPSPQTDGARWTAQLGARGDGELGGYTRDVAAVIDTRQAELGDRVATENPAWARALGERPDPATEPDAEQGWRERAGVTAFYREAAGLDPDQLSLGEPPPRERPVERALYNAALAANPGATPAELGGRDWRAVPDAELYAAREVWDREFAQAPEWTATEAMATHRFARGYREDAAIEGARAEAMPEGPARDEVAEDAARALRFAEQHEARLVELEATQRARSIWWDDTEPARIDAAAAMTELDRRGLPPERIAPDPALEVEPAAREQRTPQDQTPEPQAFQRERKALEQAAAARLEKHLQLQETPEAAAQQTREAATRQARDPLAGWRSLDYEMSIDEEIRSRYLDHGLGGRHGLDHTREMERDRGDGPELDW